MARKPLARHADTRAKTILSELNEQPKLDPMALIYSAESCSVLGEKDKAFQFLEAAYQERASLLIFLGVRPTFGNLRSDPRFADLLRRMGLREVPLREPSLKQAKA